MEQAIIVKTTENNFYKFYNVKIKVNDFHGKLYIMGGDNIIAIYDMKTIILVSPVEMQE